MSLKCKVVQLKTNLSVSVVLKLDYIGTWWRYLVIRLTRGLLQVPVLFISI